MRNITVQYLVLAIITSLVVQCCHARKESYDVHLSEDDAFLPASFVFGAERDATVTVAVTAEFDADERGFAAFLVLKRDDYVRVLFN